MAFVTAEDIVEILTATGITASELARLSHVSRSYISHLQNERKRNPSRLFASQIVQVCRDVSLGDIADRISRRIAEAEKVD